MSKLVLNALQGKETERIPIWFMRQAGRYLPEYIKVRKGKTFEDMVQNPDVACEITLQPIQRFDLDAAIIFSDILIPIYALNRGLVIKPAIGPVIEKPIQNEQDIDDLEQVIPKDDFPYLAESIKKVKSALSSDKTLIGFSGAPFTIASYLLEGKSTRTAMKTKAFAYTYPKAYDKLLHFISDMIILQLQAQKEAGVEVLQIFDSWATTLSPQQYKVFALPYTKKIIKATQLLNISKIHFAQGSGHLLNQFVNTGADCLSIDVSSEMTTVLDRIPKQLAIQGNLDPAILFTNPEIVKRETKDLLDKTNGKKNYIFNLGRGIDKDTPIENVSAMVETVKEYTR